MTESALSRWQDPQNEGFPTDAYFDAVARALADAGVRIADGWRDEPWDLTLKLDDGVAAGIGYAALIIGWRVDEESEPLTSDWEGLQSGICGWHWVPCSNARAALGDFAEGFDLDVLAEPEQVAAAVVKLVQRDDSTDGLAARR